MASEGIKQVFGEKVRVRVCGLSIKDNALLLVQHKGVGEEGLLWAPPGGGLTLYESTENALKREFQEETGLRVAVGDFMFVNEYIEKGMLHAVELFFKVEVTSGVLQVGVDPELSSQAQIIKSVRYVTFNEIALMDNKILHNILHLVQDEDDLLNMRGYFKLCQ